MNDFGCTLSWLAVGGFVLSLLALLRTRSGPRHTLQETQDAIERTAREIDRIWKQLRLLEQNLEALRSAQAQGPAAAPAAEPAPAAVPAPAAAPVPVLPPPPAPPRPAPVVQAAAPAAPRPTSGVPPVPPAVPAPSGPASATQPIPVVAPAAATPIPAVPPPPPAPAAAAPPAPPPVPQPVTLHAAPVPEPPPPPVPPLEPVAVATPPTPPPAPVPPAVPAAVPPTAAASAAPVMVPPPAPTSAPSAAPPVAARPAARPLPPPALALEPERPRRNLEDFLGTQLFLKAGVAILVIGVVFAMGLVFQKLGPLGKLLMGYLGGAAMLAGGLFAERIPIYRTFGRAIIAGAWGILYFVTYAGGFIEASKVFPSGPVAITALLLAAAATVGFSLRYRNEWTTTSAFLLIFLALAMAAWDLQPTFNLAATAIVALAMAVLVWRTGWVRLLGLGLPATWATLTFWILRRPQLAADFGLLGTLLLCWAAFQLVLIFFDGEPEREKWIGLSQIGNFLGGFGLCLQQTFHQGHPWVWAAGFGLANLAVAWAYARRGRRTMYLLAASEAIAALALVTPLRLGWKHHLTPVYRLFGIELLLVGGLLLKERYFRRVAYAAFGLALVEIVALKLDPALGLGRTLLLGAAAGLWLLDGLLLRTLWAEVLEPGGEGFAERRQVPSWFGVAGTAMTGLLVWFEVPLKFQGVAFAALALLWLLAGWRRAWKDALATAPLLGLLGAGCAVWALAAIPGGPFAVPVRWTGAAATALLLAAGLLALRRPAGAALAEGWDLGQRAAFGIGALGVAWAWLLRELPRSGAATGFAALALALLAAAVAGRRRDLAAGAFATLVAALGLLLVRPAAAEVVHLHVSAHGWSLLGVAAAALAMEELLRRPRADGLCTEAAGRAFRATAGLAGLALLVLVLLSEPPRPWRPVALAGLAVACLGLGLWRRQRERAFAALGLLAGALLLLVVDPAPGGAGVWPLSPQGWSLVGVAALTFLFEALVRRPAAEDLLSAALRTRALPAVVLAGWALGCWALFTELPRPWIAPGLAAAALLCLLLALLWRHREKAWVSLGILAFSGVALAVRPAPASEGWLRLRVESWTWLGVAALAFAMEFLLRRARSGALLGEGPARRWAVRGVASFGLTLAVLTVFAEVPRAWIAVTCAALAVLHLGLGLLWTHRDRAFACFGLLALALAELWLQPAPGTLAWARVTVHGWTLVGVAAAAFLMELGIRLPQSDRVFDARERQAALWVFSFTATVLALLAIWTEAPDAWIAPLMTALSVLLLWLGLLLGFKEQVATSAFTGLAGMAAVAFLGPRYHGAWMGVAIRAWNLGLLAGLSLGQELILRGWRKAWRWSEASRQRLAGIHSLKAVLLLGALVVLEFRPVWVVGGLLLLALLWIGWARWRPSVLHAGEACVFALAALLLMLGVLLVPGYGFPGTVLGIPERIVFLGSGLLLAFLFQDQLQRAQEEPEDRPERLNQLLDLVPLGAASLLAAAALLAAASWQEARAHRVEAWLAPAWGLVGMLCFERGRRPGRRLWTWLGHAWMGFAFVQLLDAGLRADAPLLGASLRLWTSLPTLGLLLAVYGRWARIHAQVEVSAVLRAVYLHLAQLGLALLLHRELPRPWVLPAWALQALAALLVGRGLDRREWTRAATLLALFACGRGVVINLQHWDAFDAGGANLVALPLACAALLGGYLRLRTEELRRPQAEPPEDGRSLLDGTHRMPWLAMSVVLLLGFIWMEASGKSLTMWITIFGFGLVGLGFLTRERVARLLGLTALSACTLKLFLWDLRGLHGLPRVGSFIVLGVVLITVSFVYTRFKARIERLL